ncbi:hypothetical protein BOW91_gp062 [Synechococcus phage S-WAM2]|uniref:Uncharacterized protein n=1 Tax=Synechococcus phage S-WAM2 TaxID=1815522 RepID=A0A1D8KTJ3_9CAUD|nr:hypothetical protein BOW91_gp062 [Synechococcus phage S-WAM2]AOV61884.1 hypothetical protein P29B0810_189 [Synechococcus phage S-WAM2]
MQTAEEAVRQALINALAEGEDQYLTDLFNLLNSVRNMNKKVSNTISYTDNTTQWAKDWSEYNFNLTSDYLNRPGGDLDAMDNIRIDTNSPDVISFGDYKSRDD